MKVIFVNGSSHANGTTMQAVKEMQKVFSAEGVESKVVQLGNQPIRDCIQCVYCGTHDACVFRDDAVNQFTALAKRPTALFLRRPSTTRIRADAFWLSLTGRFTPCRTSRIPLPLSPALR